MKRVVLYAALYCTIVSFKLYNLSLQFKQKLIQIYVNVNVTQLPNQRLLPQLVSAILHGLWQPCQWKLFLCQKTREFLWNITWKFRQTKYMLMTDMLCSHKHCYALTCLFSASVPICPCKHATILLCVLCETTRTNSIRRSICAE